MFGSVGGLISTWTYIPSDAPTYRIGHGINLGCAVAWTALAIAGYYWMKMDNKKRDEREVFEREKLIGMEQKEIEDLEWKHPAWRWKP